MSATFAFALLLVQQAVPSASDLADAKCVAAMTLLGDRAEASEKADMQSAMLFFMGKIVGRSGNAAVAPALNAVVEQMKAAEAEGVAAIAEQCAPQISAATKGM